MSNKLKSNVLFVAVTQGGVALLSLLLSVSLTRMLDPAMFGKYVLALSVAGSVVAVGTQWITQSANRYLPVVTGINDKNELKTGIVVGLTVLYIVLLVCGMGSYVIVTIVKPEYVNFVVPVTAIAIFAATFAVGTRVIQASGAPKHFGLCILAFAVLKFLLTLGAVHFIGHRVAMMLWAETLANGLLLPVVWKISQLPNGLFIFNAESRKTAFAATRRLWLYGGLMTGWFVGAAIMSIGDRYLIGLLRNASEVGVYTANYNLINGSVGLAATPVLLVLHPFLMKSWAEHDLANFAVTLRRIVEGIWCVGVLLVGVFCVFSYDIANYLFPPQYVAGHLVMPIAVLGILFWNIGLYVHKPLECGEKSGILMFLSIGCAIFNAVLNLLFIPRYGYLAAAVSTTVTYCAYCALCYFLGKRHLNWTLPWLRCLWLTVIVGVIVALSHWIKVSIAVQYGGLIAVASALPVYIGLSGMVFMHNRKLLVFRGVVA